MADRPSRLTHRMAVWALCLLSIGAAQAQQLPPNCTDEASLKPVKKQYNGAELASDAGKIKEIKDVKETYYGPAPESFNQYANSGDHVLSVRWCQATLVLNDGQGDTLYWFLADAQKGDKHSTVQDHCSTRHNLMDSTCAKWLEHR